MTIEEAAEVILEGKAYRPCPKCKGTKYSRIVLNDQPIMVTCYHCRSGGVTRSSRYMKACRLLGKKAPPFLPDKGDWVFPGDIPEGPYYEVFMNGTLVGRCDEKDLPLTVGVPLMLKGSKT